VRLGERESNDEVGERRVKDTGEVELESGDDVGGESVSESVSDAEGTGIGIEGEISKGGLDDRAIIAIGCGSHRYTSRAMQSHKLWT
jgi:hypothetical protein